MVKCNSLYNMFKIIEAKEDDLYLSHKEIAQLIKSVKREELQIVVKLLTSYRSLNFLFDIMNYCFDVNLTNLEPLQVAMKYFSADRGIIPFYLYGLNDVLNSMEKENYKLLMILMNNHMYLQVLIELYRSEEKNNY